MKKNLILLGLSGLMFLMPSLSFATSYPYTIDFAGGGYPNSMTIVSHSSSATGTCTATSTLMLSNVSYASLPNPTPGSGYSSGYLGTAANACQSTYGGSWNWGNLNWSLDQIYSWSGGSNPPLNTWFWGGTLSCGGLYCYDFLWEKSSVDGTIIFKQATLPLSINFSYPTESLSTLDFANWVLNVANADTSTIGSVSVNYGISSSSLVHSDTGAYFGLIGNQNFSIPKSVLLNPIINLSETSTWYAQAVMNYGTSTLNNTVTSSIISFVIDPNASNPNTTSSIDSGLINSNPFNASSTATSTLGNPYSCSGITDIKNCALYVLYSGGQLLFQPNGNASDYLLSSVNYFKSVMPFSIAFNILNTVQSAANSVPNSSQANYVISLGNSSSTLNLTDSSTLSSAFGSSNKSLIFTWEDYLLYLGLMLAIFMTVYNFGHHISGTKNAKKKL